MSALLVDSERTLHERCRERVMKVHIQEHQWSRRRNAQRLTPYTGVQLLLLQGMGRGASAPSVGWLRPMLAVQGKHKIDAVRDLTLVQAISATAW